MLDAATRRSEESFTPTPSAIRSSVASLKRQHPEAFPGPDPKPPGVGEE